MADFIGVFVGCNYPGQPAALNGCVNDVRAMWDMLRPRLSTGIAAHATFMVDVPQQLAGLPGCDVASVRSPTKANIVQAWEDTVALAKASVAQGKRPFVFFHFSGHGGSTIDTSRDEVDGRDETLYPTDFATSGVILDDDVNRLLLCKLPKEARCVLFLDECHSGTAGDLCYAYDPALKRSSVASIDRTKQPVCRAMAISGCKDTQTSADAFINGKFQGATTAGATQLFPSLLSATGTATIASVGEAMHRFMASGRYAQRPQITASFPLSPSTRFLLADLFQPNSTGRSPVSSSSGDAAVETQSASNKN